MIRIRGAREHNLKNIDVDLPRNALIVISGLSGSGKSSLAFDTLYAEGQRRYVESLSAYARQFLDRLGKPAVDSIEGLSPAISIDQKTTSRNPRSTVGTVTEIQDYLRLLFARVGTPHCPNDGSPIEPMSLDQILERLFGQEEGQRARILAPLVENRKGTHKKLLDTMRKDGFLRAVIDGEEAFLEQVATLEKTVPHTIKLVVDRVVLHSEDRARIAESIETALRLGEGLVEIDLVDENRIEIFSEKNACLQCGEGFPDLTPQLFSFNSPAGACPECDGLGTSVRFDPALVVRHPDRSLLDGAIPALTGSSGDSYGAGLVRNVVEHFGVAPTLAWERLPEHVQHAVLYGTTEAVTFKLENKKKTRSYTYKRRFEGAIPQLERRLRETGSQRIRDELDKYMRVSECPACQGDRLNTFARNVKVSGSTIGTLVHMELADLLERLETFNFDPRAWQIAEKLMQEIRDRTGFLVHVGLDYLCLSRAAHTLSGGEAQRIRLATQIGSKLVGVLYVLDEPSIGLHQSDQARLIETLRALRDLGNTVIVVEHDEDTIRAADHVVDLGPGAGVRGGYLIAQGTPEEVEANQESVTGQYLASAALLRDSQTPLLDVPAETLALRGCTLHNLQGVDLHIPLQRFVTITGVSGSGKSSLIMDTLYPVLSNRLHSARLPEGPHDALEGVDSIQKVLEIDQNPIGRTPRSNPATYSGVFTDIRELFAQTQEARARGYAAGRFSFNVKGGRCESCQGDGYTRIEMHFLPDVFVECDVCRGTRYNRETLDIHYKGLTIVDVLNMDVDEALAFFENVPSIRRKLDTLHRVGLGYIKLGQPATTLSGGEAQRLKLSRELVRKHSDHTLYILDEPTTGLHFDDVKRLVHVLTALVESGNTVVVIEHNLDLIAAADWVVDLGPAGGHKGGRILAEATPEDLAGMEGSRTGLYLRDYFERKQLRAAKVD